MRILDTLKAAGEALETLIYPPHCVICRAATQRGAYLCEDCLEARPRLRAPFCKICSQPFDGDITGEFECANCGGRAFHFECAIAAFRGRGVVRELVHRFKYQGQFHLRVPLGRCLCEVLADSRLADWPFDALTPVPLHPSRKRERGFNQSLVLAEFLGVASGRPVHELLRRVRRTATQTRFDRESRMENLRNAFDLIQNAPVEGMRILLVDDVLTTGTTLDECARVLRRGGAVAVRAAVVARS